MWIAISVELGPGIKVGRAEQVEEAVLSDRPAAHRPAAFPQLGAF